jgi:TetR/AcrR family transcriptional regulator, cholesterol catabolism regulator
LNGSSHIEKTAEAVAAANDPRPSRRATGRKPTAKAHSTRQHILACAASVFAERGYELTRLRDIADRAELHLTALYYHYDSKDALAGELLMVTARRRSEGVRLALAQLPVEAPLRARIETLNRAYLGEILRDDPFLRASVAILGQVAPATRERMLEITREDGEVWRTLLTEAQRTGEIGASVDIDMVRMLLIGSMNWSIEWFDPRRGLPDRVAWALNRMLFDGIQD